MKILDVFAVMLSLDDKGYKSGVDRVKKQQKDLVDSTKESADKTEDIDKKSQSGQRKRNQEQSLVNKKLSESFGMIKREAIGAMAVLMGANSLRDYVAKTTTAFSNLDRTARAAGLSARELGAFGQMIEVNGGKAETAQASIATLAKVMEDYRTGLKIPSGDMLLGLNRIGAGPQDSALEVFQKYANWAEGKDKRLVAQEGNLLGFDEGSIDMAMRGGKAVAEALKSMRDSMPTDQDVEKIRDLQRAWRQLGADMGKAAATMLADVSPALADILDKIDGLITKTSHVNQTGGLLAFLQLSLGFATGNSGLMVGAGQTFFNSVTPNDPGQSNPYTAGSSIGGSKRAAQARAFFQSQGYTAAQAAGIVGVLQNESGGNLSNWTGAMYKGERAFGIGQWRGRRKAELLRFAHKTSLSQVTFEDQLRFAAYELNHGESAAGDRIRASRTVAGAAYGMASFERPHREGSREFQAYVARGARNGMGSTQTVNVQNLNVHTQAKSSPEIARDIKKSLKGNPIVSSANSGVY